jgi:hypothetical protein
MVEVQDEPSNESVKGDVPPKTDSGPRAWIHIPFIVGYKVYKAISKALDRADKVEKIVEKLEPPDTKRCVNVDCGEAIPAYATFCQHCGARQPEV